MEFLSYLITVWFIIWVVAKCAQVRDHEKRLKAIEERMRTEEKESRERIDAPSLW